MAKKKQCIFCNHMDRKNESFICHYYENKPVFDNKYCYVYSENVQPVKKQGCGLIFLKVLYIIFSFLILTMFIEVDLQPYLRTIQQGELSAVGWMVFPIMIISIIVLFRPFRVSIELFNGFIAHIQIISISIYKMFFGKSLAVIFNITIFVFFLVLTTISSFLILYGWHLCLYGLWGNLLFLILGIILDLLSMTYFRYISSKGILCKSA